MALGVPCYKIILCGEYGVGKSSLFRRFVDNSFTVDAGPQSTMGLDYFSKSFYVKGKEIKLELWDTAGIERFATLSSSYFHNASAAVLCYSNADRDSFNQLSQHLLEIIVHSKTAKVFLCATKYDLKTHDQISDSDLANFSDQCDTALSGLFMTSSRDGVGIKEMFQEIAEILVSDYEERISDMPTPLKDKDSFKVQNKSSSSCCSGEKTS